MSRRRLFGWAVVLALVGVGVVGRDFLVATYSFVSYWQLRPDYERAGHGLTNVQAHPEFILLPFAERILDDGQWATPSARETLKRLRGQYRHDRRLLDFYLAAWDYWNGRVAEARRVFEQQGQAVAVVQAAARLERWDEVRAWAEDARTTAEVRCRAWQLLAARAETVADGQQAAAHYLKALENLPGGVALLWQRPAWAEVRQRLGQTITPAQYAASLNVLAARVTEQSLLEEIMFELGKLKMLAEAGGNPG